MRLLLHSLRFIDVTRDTSQASMAPCVEPASQSAPVPDPQAPFLPVKQYVSSPDPDKLPGHSPTHPNSAVCSALRSAGTKMQAAVVPDVSCVNPAAEQDAAQLVAPGGENVPAAHASHWVSSVRPVWSEYLPAEHTLQQVAFLTTLASS